MTQRTWQIGMVALATAVLAACGGGDAPSSSTSQAEQTKTSALAATAKSESPGRIEPSESGGKATGKNSIYIVRMAEIPSRLTAAASRATRHEARQGPEDRPDQCRRRRLQGLPRGTPERSAGRRRRRQEALQLRLRLQRLRRRADRSAGAKLAQTAGVLAVSSDEIRQPDTSSTPDVPRPHRAERLLGQHRRQGRERRHRHDRHRHLARAPELLGPHRQQRQRHARTASSPTSRSPAGTASADRASSSTPATATRS